MSRKSKFRSLAAAFVTAVMVLAVGVTSAFAAVNGKITVTGAEDGKTYSLYKVFDATASGNNVAYTYTSKGGSDAFLEVLQRQDSPFELKQAATGEYGVTLKQGKTGENVSEFLKANVAKLGNPTDVVASGGNAVFGNLDVGYYYISTTIGSAVIIRSANLDVTIADKNEAPTLAKVITKDGGTTNLVSADGSMAIAESGSKIAYKLTVPIKKGAVNYEIVDVMDKALTYNEASLKVMLGEEAVATDKYTVKYTVAKPAESTANTLTITFANDWLAANAKSKKSIVVTYSATLDSADHSTAPVKNTAKLLYGTSDDVTPEVSTEVKNASINVIKKAESDTGNNLAGAGFVFKRADGKFYKRDTNGLSWVDTMDKATELTSNGQGQLVSGDQVTTFHGLANGEYTLIEKTVPAGYNKADDTTVTVNAGAKGGWVDAVFVHQITVVNKAGSLLPSTGGMGTTLLYVGGAVLVVGAVVMLVVRRRMSENN